METTNGIVTRVDIKNRRFVLVPLAKEERKNNRTLFVFNPEGLKVTQNGEKADPTAIKHRQRAEVGYITKNDKKIARSVEIKNAGATTSPAG